MAGGRRLEERSTNFLNRRGCGSKAVEILETPLRNMTSPIKIVMRANGPWQGTVGSPISPESRVRGGEEGQPLIIQEKGQRDELGQTMLNRKIRGCGKTYKKRKATEKKVPRRRRS